MMIGLKKKNSIRQNRFRGSWWILPLILVLVVPGCGERVKERVDKPGGEWLTSTPEAQGLDSQVLAGMMREIREKGHPLHSVLIIRKGRLVTEAYIHPFKKEYRHIIFSATKSISALLIGIAIQEGFIQDENQRVLDFFTQYKGNIAHLDARKESLSLYHLLTMSAGFQWQDHPYGIWAKGDFSRLLASGDGIKYILDKPVAHEPGTVFAYNSGCSHLLAAVVRQAVGKSALQYAKEKLFAPLGITGVGWGAYHQGIHNGASEMFLTPRDMAKIGLLVLNKGTWEGRRVLSPQWLEKATAAIINSDMPHEKEEYGYQWYTKNFLGKKVISAEGLGGNCIFVIPELDMVVVFTGGLTRAVLFPYQLLKGYIIPAAKSPRALPPNPEANREMARLLREVREPGPGAPRELPAPAGAVSGRTFYIREGDNPLGIKRVSLSFKQKGEAQLTFLYAGTGKTSDWGVDMVYRSRTPQKGETELVVRAGLDGRFRTIMVDHPECGRVPFSARGSWKGENILELTMLSAWSLPGKWVLEFKDPETLTLSIKNPFYKFSITGKTSLR